MDGGIETKVGVFSLLFSMTTAVLLDANNSCLFRCEASISTEPPLSL